MFRWLALLLMSPLAAISPAHAQAAAPAASFASERIGVEVRGSGPDVVLIPGLSSSPRVWDSTIAALPGYRYHVIHVSGFSGRPAGANAEGPVLAPVAEEIARYMRESGLERPAVVGHSMGGTWAMMVAARHPELAGRVMVVDMLPFLGAMFGGPTATPDSLRPIAEQIRQGIVGATPEERRRQVEQTIASMVRTESMRAEVAAQSLDSDVNVGATAFSELVVTDLRPEIARISAPMRVLYVNPAGSPFPPEQMDRFYAASYAGVNGVTLRRFPESYHFIMFDDAEAFQADLTAFLRGEAAQAPAD